MGAASITATSKTSKTAKKEPSAKPKAKRKPSDLQKELKRVEREIEKLENELGEISHNKAEFSSDYEKLMELDAQESDVNERLEGLMGEWEQLADA
jgi:prefoldin subunit 5